MKIRLKNLSLISRALFTGIIFFLSSLAYQPGPLSGHPQSTMKAAPKPRLLPKYRGFEVKTGIVNDEIQYSLVRENSVEFRLNEKCQPENIRVKVGGKEYGYRQVERVIEDGRIEKNDLFAYICYQPEVLAGGDVNPEEVQFKFYRGKISPVISPDYPLFATLRLSADRLGIKTPHRTFAVLNGFGNASHEFFCYLEGGEEIAPEADECAISFDEILDLHLLNKNSTALMDLGDKYARRFDYEKAEKAYLKGLSLPGENDYQRLIDLYLSSGQAAKARKYLQSLLKQSPLNFNLHLLLAKVYLHEKEYEKAIAAAETSLKLRTERGQYESYAVIGQAQFGQQNYLEGIKALGRAAVLAEKECQENRELFDKFFRQEEEVYDCRLTRIPFEQAIIYGLIALEEYDQAERGAEALIKISPNDPHNYGWLAFIDSARGQFDKAEEQADQCLTLFRRRGLGASIGQGEIYPQIISVQQGRPADRAGLKRGDRIIAVNGKDLRLFREQEKPDQALARLVRQEGESLNLLVHPAGAAELKTVELSAEELLDQKAAPVARLKELIASSKYKVDRVEFKKLLDEFYFFTTARRSRS